MVIWSGLLMPDHEAVERLTRLGYAFVPAADAVAALDVSVEQLNALRDAWSRLPRDAYLRDGGRYRSRRHSCFVQEFPAGTLSAVALVTAPVWIRLVASLGTLFAAVKGAERWFIEAHQFRIDTASGIGRPTPEGAHRDGVDFVALILVERYGIRGGETRVFDTEGPSVVRFTMTEPWSMLLLDDARVVHETTPILPGGVAGFRDTLVLTFRAGGFQAPD
jgi:hypothetical protein